MSPFEQLLVWNEQSVQFCHSLSQALRAERNALIMFQMNDLVEATMQKEQAGRQLAALRKKAKEGMARWFGAVDTPSLEPRLPEKDRERWKQSIGAWDSAWQETLLLCEQNQRFLKHSLKNLGMLVDNLKHLLGNKATYSSKGTKVDKPFQGKVIEGRF